MEPAIQHAQHISVCLRLVYVSYQHERVTWVQTNGLLITSFEPHIDVVTLYQQSICKMTSAVASP